MSQLFEQYDPYITQNGIITNKNVTIGGSANFDMSGSTGTFKLPTGAISFGGNITLAANENITAVAGTTAFDLSLGTGIFKTTTGINTMGGATNINSASATALTVATAGSGLTNPAFQVDASTASQAAGFKIVGAIAAGTVAASVISSGAAANLTIDALGTGTIGIGTVSTGTITLGSAVSVASGKTITSYNGMTTAGQGVPPIVATVNLTGQTSAQTNAINFTPPAATGVYRVGILYRPTATGASTSVGFTLAYKDSTGSVSLTTIPFGDAATTSLAAPPFANTSAANKYATYTFQIDNSATAITLSTTGTFTGTTYNLAAWLERLA